MRPVAHGVPIASLAPQTADFIVCRVNGEWLLRESWGSLTRPGDVIEWYEVPQDRDALRSVLGIAAIAFLGPGAFGIAGLGLTGVQLGVAVLASQLALNALLPPTAIQQQAGPQQTGSAFSTSLAGNEARLDQPIWKVCGRREINPPFAAQPYLEYLPRDGAEDPNLDREQYYYALLAVGVGDHDIAAVKIGNTPISRFADVLLAQYLPPGTSPTTVQPNVTTANEVSGQVLDPFVYVGGFAACAARRTCQSIGVDVTATRGLGKTGELTVTWDVEWRPINDFGQALGSWALLASETRTAFTSTPQRWSSRYDLGSAARVEIRVVRTDNKDDSPSALHEIAWTGLRAYLAEPAPLNEHTAHYEIVLRASSQLSQTASRDVRLIVEAQVRSLDENLDWLPAAHSRNPAWWVLDLVTSPTWGMSRPDAMVDLQSFYDLAQTCEERQDRFDWTFDSTTDGWSAAQLIARTARARVFRRGINGVISIARDELADVPVTAFTPRNCVPGMKLHETLRTRKSPDGVVIEYQDHRTWEWTEIECPCPGVSEMTNPVRKRIEGIVGATHAEREGLYEAANLLYRTRTAEWTTEMQGLLPAYMSPVGVQLDGPGYGQSGDVAFWDADTMVMTLTEPPDWSAAPLTLQLIRDDGTINNVGEVLPGPTANDVTLAELPDFELVLDSGLRERPKYVLGKTDMAKVMAIGDGGKSDDDAQLYQMTALLDDDRVHNADVHLLPGPGDIQDPVGNPDDDGGGGVALVVRLRGQLLYGESSMGAPASATLTFHGDGSTTAVGAGNAAGGVTPLPTLHWLSVPPHETSVTGTYEILATLLSGTTPTTGTLDAWTPLSSDFVLEMLMPGDSDGDIFANLRVQIRDAGGIVQATANYGLSARIIPGGGGS